MEKICRNVSWFHQLAMDQDRIGWKRFMEGFVTHQMVETQLGYQSVIGA